MNKFTRFVLAMCAGSSLVACQPSADTETTGGEAADANMSDSGQQPVEALQITDLKTGEGAVAENGKSIVVHYTGWLYEPATADHKGNKFDSSVDRGQPFEFPLGAGRVIQGWEQGFSGMRVGGQRRLIIPPELGYGARGVGASIPPNATLMFEVELLDVR